MIVWRDWGKPKINCETKWGGAEIWQRDLSDMKQEYQQFHWDIFLY